MCPCVSVSQIRSKKYALGKGNLMSNKLRQILLNLLMETGKTEKAVIQSKGRRRLIKSDNIWHMELNPCSAEPEGLAVPWVLQ